MATPTKDFYRTLGVAENASADEIKKAYRKLAKQFHPDANAGDPAAAERFKEISEANAVLSDHKKRKQYDQMRKFGGFAAPGAGYGARRGAAGGAQQQGGFSFEDLGGVGGLGDIFGSIFDMGRKRGRGQGQQRGQNVEYAVEIPFELAARGGKLPVSIPMTEECPTCSGSGARPGTSTVTCPECKGSGTVTFGQGGFAVSRPCPACYGKGVIAPDPCTTCEGRGQIRQQRQIQLTVPAGVDTGSKLRLPGQGEPGAGGGPPGDLIISFRVEPHHFFRRDGLNIEATVPVNIAQATLGSKIRVKTVDGKRVVLRVPPGTQSGTRFRIKGQGIEKGAQRGDQFIRVDVAVPKNLNKQEAALMKEFAGAASMRF